MNRKELYTQILTIVSDDGFPILQAQNLTELAQSDGRLYLIFYLLLIALKVLNWRRQGEYLHNQARVLEERAGLLETLNTVE